MKSFWMKITLLAVMSVITLDSNLTPEGIGTVLLLLCVVLFIQFIHRNSVRLGVLILYICASLLYPNLVNFVPLLIYPAMPYYLLLPLSGLILINVPFPLSLIHIFLLITCYLLDRLESKTVIQSHALQTLSDTMTTNLKDEKSHFEALRVQQERDLELTLLNERNRIARDIHDNVGHLLSSALLQVGALKAQHPDMDFHVLKDTLDQGMTSIRSSVHALYNDSFNLESEIQSVLNTQQKFEVNLRFSLVSEPPATLKATLLFIIKEALNNALKHSNATEIHIKLDESENNYHCLFFDNGSLANISYAKGIGLLSIEKRVKDVRGLINIQSHDGFRIYVTLPKEVQ